MARASEKLKIGCIALVLSFIIISMPFIGFAQAGVTEYTQYRGDNSNDGTVQTKGVPLNDMAWKFKTDSGIDSSPAVANEKVYFGSKDGSVYCVEMYSGAEKWRFPTTGEIKGTPLLRSGKCFIGSSDGSLYCLNAEYGTDQWSFETGGKVVSSPKYYKDKLYFGSDDGKLYAIWSDNGSMAWNFTMSNSTKEFWSSAAIDGGVLFIGDDNGWFVALDAETGELLDDVMVAGADIYTTACMYDSKMVFATGLGRSLVQYEWTGDELKFVWEFKTEHDTYTSAGYFNGTVYFSDYAHVFALPWDDPNSDGEITEDEVKWTFPIDNHEGGSSPLIFPDRLVIGTKADLHCIYLDNGTEVWTRELERGGYMVSTPTYIDHFLFYTTNDKHLYCLRGKDLSAGSLDDDGDDDEEFNLYLGLTIPIAVFILVDLILLAVIVMVRLKGREPKPKKAVEKAQEEAVEERPAAEAAGAAGGTGAQGGGANG